MRSLMGIADHERRVAQPQMLDAWAPRCTFHLLHAISAPHVGVTIGFYAVLDTNKLYLNCYGERLDSNLINKGCRKPGRT